MKISDKKRNKIYEQILAVLYSTSPKPLFTVQIAQEIARDEEFIKKLLFELKSKKLIIEIKKSPKGFTTTLERVPGAKTIKGPKIITEEEEPEKKKKKAEKKSEDKSKKKSLDDLLETGMI